MTYETIDTDVLVIGAGGAGARAAIEAANHNVMVTLLSKELLGKAHTCMAEGGVNATFANVDPPDNWEVHFKDTIEGGAWINNQKLVEILTREACDRIMDLEEYGAIFDRTPEGKIMQRPFGKQTYRRTCYAADRTGHEMMVTLTEEIRRRDVDVMEEVFVTNLLAKDNQVQGAVGISFKTGSLLVFKAKATILASGGGGRVYKITSNAAQDTGDGYAVAYHAGCRLLDMEMVQFHPTGMVFPESHRGCLVTEGVRGEGGLLKNIKGERFMQRYDAKRMELAGRDVVARANATEILEGRGTEHGGVYLDVTHLPPHIIEERLPTMLEQFLDVGVDIRKEPMEVAPTAHHLMGGVEINENAETTLKGMYAAGEIAGGVHGGNRLGGNALADTQVFGKRAGENAAMFAKKSSMPIIDRSQVEKEANKISTILERKEGIRPHEIKNRLQTLMWDKVGIFRTGQELQEAVQAIEEMKAKDLPRLFVMDKHTRYNKELIETFEIENMLTIAEMIAKAALMREESRGAHFRKDFPKTDNKNWFANIYIQKKMGQMTLTKLPVVVTTLKPEGA
ncbi:MAG: fumarate reductase (CoM/CoB) subunit TfrA [Candidatus Bathyarchaeia archaeon]|nr:fumarate reductase subunit A [Candidatus Bathyarchaeota archaeon A05DMB-4]MDH7594868.1 fumarate reductase subunit A [Candidatus Bathyarchaeota archaeon]